MPPNAILHEVQQLHKVSDRLDSLAEQHPFRPQFLSAVKPLVSDALITIISGSARNTATLLGAGGDENSADFRIRFS